MAKTDKTTLSTAHIMRDVSFWIDEDAQLLPLVFTVTLTSGRPAPSVKRIWATLEIAYKQNQRNDVYTITVEFAPRFGSQTANIPIPDVRGGTVTFTGYARVKHRNGQNETVSDTTKTNVHARQPLNANVRTYLEDKNLEVVIYHLSKFQQFDANGLPVFANGFGMYQLKQPVSEQIWNWKKHVDAAKIDFAARMETVRQIPANLRSTSPDYASLPDFTSAQVLMETFQTYGVGAFYKPFRKTSQSRWQWVANSENDGFGAKCENTKKAVANGNPPSDWN